MHLDSATAAAAAAAALALSYATVLLLLLPSCFSWRTDLDKYRSANNPQIH